MPYIRRKWNFLFFAFLVSEKKQTKQSKHKKKANNNSDNSNQVRGFEQRPRRSLSRAQLASVGLWLWSLAQSLFGPQRDSSKETESVRSAVSVVSGIQK